MRHSLVFAEKVDGQHDKYLNCVSELSVTSCYSCGHIPESPMSEPPPIADYTIGWICALQEEYEAACRMIDGEFDGAEASEANDNNTYVFGHIGGHNVVIGCLPDGRYGTSSAASVAKDMIRSFPNLRFALMVGIGGGAPTRERDIRLGDVWWLVYRSVSLEAWCNTISGRDCPMADSNEPAS